MVRRFPCSLRLATRRRGLARAGAYETATLIARLVRIEGREELEELAELRKLLKLRGQHARP